jgi:hypothetical protein
MTVTELIDELEDYGGNLEVLIQDPQERTHPLDSVASLSSSDGVTVILGYG